MELTTEYLVIIEKNSASALYDLCDTSQEFRKLLQKDPNFVIKDGKLIFKDNLECSFSDNTDKVKGKDQRFFHVLIAFSGNESGIDQYIQALRAFRKIVVDSGGQLETLNNDVSTYFANQSYPLIHKLENLMRKLISYFMLTQVGREWVTEASPKDVIEAIDKSKNPQQFGDALHQVDFIHLGNFLFKAYQKKTREVLDLYDLIDSVTKSEDLNLEDLRDYKPKSNWERYFSRVVDCTDTYLKSRWEELYELRCKVAHNAIINKNDYERISQLVEEVSEKLQNAINNIGSIQVPEEEKVSLVENVVSNVNDLYGEFIILWRSFEIALNQYAVSQGVQVPILNDLSSQKQRVKAPKLLLDELLTFNLIPLNVHQSGIFVSNFRNLLVHQGGTLMFNEEDIARHIIILKRLLYFLQIPQDLTTWKDEVAQALRALGGEAELSDIYNYIESNTKRELSETWRSSVRRTLQSYSSDMKHYLGGDDLFEHVDTGRWGLRTP